MYFFNLSHFIIIHNIFQNLNLINYLKSQIIGILKNYFAIKFIIINYLIHLGYLL